MCGFTGSDVLLDDWFVVRASVSHCVDYGYKIFELLSAVGFSFKASST